MIKKLTRLLGNIVGRENKMSYKTRIWNEARIRILPSDREFARGLISWIPYFWDSDISFDIFVGFPQKKGFNPLGQSRIPRDKWLYRWRLYSLDGKVVDRGEDIITITNDVKSSVKGWVRKYDAIKFENPLMGRYKLYSQFTDSKGVSSDDWFFTSFTITDKTEYMSSYFLPAIISLVVSLLVSLLFGGR